MQVHLDGGLIGRHAGHGKSALVDGDVDFEPLLDEAGEIVERAAIDAEVGGIVEGFAGLGCWGLVGLRGGNRRRGKLGAREQAEREH